MSKSAENPASRIALLDTPEEIARKIKKCKTDAVEGGITYNDPARPEATNLLNIYSAVSGVDIDSAVSECEGMMWGTFKPLLADAVVEHLRPIQDRYGEVMEDRGGLVKLLEEGAGEANAVANETLERSKRAMGFATPTWLQETR